MWDKTMKKITFKQLKRLVGEASVELKEPDIKVGDILYSSWGYSMIIVSFYKVVARKGGSTLILRELAQKPADDRTTMGMQGHVLPVEDEFKGEEKRARIGSSGAIRITGGYGSEYLRKWDGRPVMFDMMDEGTPAEPEDDSLEVVESSYKNFTQRELKDMVRSGEATDITGYDFDMGQELRERGYDVVGFSKGVYGLNGALLKMRDDGELMAITRRSTILAQLV